MSILTPVTDRLVDRLDAKLHPQRDWRPLDRFYGRRLTDEEHAFHIRNGRLPRERQRYLRITDPSPIVRGREGPSDEAVHLFGLARAAGGTLTLSMDIRFAGTRTRLDDLDLLVDELVALGLVDRVDGGQPAIAIAPEFADVELASSGWSRWSLNPGAVRRAGTR